MTVQTFIRSRAAATDNDLVRIPGNVLARLVLRTEFFALVETGGRMRWIANGEVGPSPRERQARRMAAQAAQCAAFVAGDAP